MGRLKGRAFNPRDPEWMDRPQPPSVELEQDLENLRCLNAWFGGHAIIRYFLRRWLRPGRTWRVLDLATASADIPRMIVSWARKRGIAVEIEAVDFQESSLVFARRRCAGFPEICLRLGDIRNFVPETRPDLVLCSLALHHFSDGDAEALLRRLPGLGKGPVLVTDLSRSWLLSAAIHALTASVFRQPMTRHDARASAARAFSFSEMKSLATRAGWEGYAHRRFLFGRQAIWLDRPAPQ